MVHRAIHDQIYNKVSITPISSIKEHEEIDHSNLTKIIEEITSKKYVYPILLDKNTKVVLDGHHRLNALHFLGFNYVPAILIDYNSDDIKVKSWRDDIEVTKEDVIKRGMNFQLYPHKTSRHLFTRENIKIPIEVLRR